jgi:hypothetical protein
VLWKVSYLRDGGGAGAGLCLLGLTALGSHLPPRLCPKEGREYNPKHGVIDQLATKGVDLRLACHLGMVEVPALWEGPDSQPRLQSRYIIINRINLLLRSPCALWLSARGSCSPSPYN